jgi:hypothetical protein
MAELGTLTRILAPVVKSYFCYVHTKDNMTAPGQLCVADQFLQLSQNRSLGPSSRVYGLLGENIGKEPKPSSPAMGSLKSLSAMLSR